MSGLHYLTVQDLLWINHRVTGKVNPFRYDALEEATFLQYGYGGSLDLGKQAAQFLAGFAAKSPFSEGNEATALVGFVAFLRANGKDASLTDSDRRNWAEKNPSANDATAKIVDAEDVHGVPDVRAIIEGVIAEMPGLAKVTSSA